MCYNKFTMRKLRLYLDTSIFNFAFSQQSPDYKEATLRLLELVREGVYEGYISEVVIREINKAGKEKAEQLMGLILDLSPGRLEINAEIERLAEEYVKAGLIPVRYTEDASHIAVASFYEIDIILSWNFEHMVKFKTKKGVVGINTLLGYKPVEILTPLEVIENV